jgi:hypothetical protein
VWGLLWGLCWGSGGGLCGWVRLHPGLAACCGACSPPCGALRGLLIPRSWVRVPPPSLNLAHVNGSDCSGTVAVECGAGPARGERRSHAPRWAKACGRSCELPSSRLQEVAPTDPSGSGRDEVPVVVPPVPTHQVLPVLKAASSLDYTHGVNRTSTLVEAPGSS